MTVTFAPTVTEFQTFPVIKLKLDSFRTSGIRVLFLSVGFFVCLALVL